MATEFEEGHCPMCGSNRADVVAQHKESFSDDMAHGATTYSVLECRGCGYFYFKSSSWNSEGIDYNHHPITGEVTMEANVTVKLWPPATKLKRPSWSFNLGMRDTVLGSLFNDIYTALDNNLGVLAAIGMRTVFDRASELLKIDPSLSFEKKLLALKDDGQISDNEVAVLGVLIDAGSAAAHRGWRPDPKNLTDMMQILEGFLHRAIILEDVAAKLKGSVPKRPASKKAKKPTT